MDVLDQVLLEEYERVIRRIMLNEKEITNLPLGYLSKKNIKGNVQYYLQKRVGPRIVSKYVSKNELDETKSAIEKRNIFKQRVKESKKQAKKLERILDANETKRIRESIGYFE